jgi:hypothetical protein
VDANGSYEPLSFFSSYSNVESYLKNATATNMAYMLSAQLLVTEFNICLGRDDALASIFLPAVPGMDQAHLDALAAHGITGNVVQVQAILNAAIAELKSAPYTPGGSADRTYEEALKDIFDAINNNLPIFM